MPFRVDRAEFIAGVNELPSLPPEGAPEIAVIGRSNVGKSSFINRLTGRRALARVSSTPGRTQQLNFFDLGLSTGDGPLRELRLVDLPGFGFAKFSKEKREDLGRLTVDYATTRDALVLVCLLNDCRRSPERDELALRDLVFESEKHLLVVLTKFDKLKRSQQKQEVEKRAKEFGLGAEDVVVTGEGVGCDPFWERVLFALE